jgi:cytochrome c
MKSFLSPIRFFNRSRRHIAASCVVSGLLAALAPASHGADESGGASAGKMAFNNNCRTCHSMKEGDNRQGPSLHGIVGAKAGASEGYAAYSGSLKGSGIVWDETTLDRFIANPDEVVPNNNMNPYTGITDEGLRKKIVEYLKSDEAQGGGE